MRLLLFLALALGSALPIYAGQRICVTPQDAAGMPGKDICVKAHVYNVVVLPDGTRFLDICPPDQPDSSCRFTILSEREDAGTVGDLFHYRDTDVTIRGIVSRMRAESGSIAGILLSHERQMRGGPPKFRPNPRLLQGYAGTDERAPVHDPNLRASGRQRSYMRSMYTVATPEAAKK